MFEEVALPDFDVLLYQPNPVPEPFDEVSLLLVFVLWDY